MIKINLRVAMAKREINQKDLSNLTGIRPNTISDLFNNKAKHLPLDTLNTLCEVLECDITDLLEYIPDEIQQQE